MAAPFLFILLHLLSTSADDCPGHPHNSLICYNDYSHNISCTWKGSRHKTDTCSIHAGKLKSKKHASCKLQPFDNARPDLKCSLIFKGTELFQSHTQVSMSLSCFPSKQSEIIFYRPACHIKLNPPPKPEANFTKLSWFSQVPKPTNIEYYRYDTELQWKQKGHRWSDLQTKKSGCQWECSAQLDEDLLLESKTYDARVRVLARYDSTAASWSDWSPTVSWVPRPRSGEDVVNLNWAIWSLAVFGLLLLPGVFITMRKNACSRIYILKKISGPPLPDPSKSTQFQTWLDPYFTSEFYQSFLKSADIVSVEETSAVDDVTLYTPDIKAMPEFNEDEFICSSFSNYSYSEFCCPPVFPLTAGSPKPHAVEASYKNVPGREDEKTKNRDSDVARREAEMVKALLMGGINHEAVVISDYKRVQKLQIELHSFHSVDSGMASYEEVSQESIEADSINMVEGAPWAQENQEINNEGNETKSDIQKLFEGSESILGKITVVSDYKQIPTIRVENAEFLRLHSADSGMDSYEEVSQESLEEDSIYMTEGYDDGSVSKERKESEIQKLFGGSEGIFCQNPPQGFSDYKQVPTIQAESPELPWASCLDSGVDKVDSESLEDIMEEEDEAAEGTRFLFPPFPPPALANPLILFSQRPLDTSQSKLGSALPPL
ncbi:uncharacterized protein LOC116720768 [Xiphophorus hellerii]|uniref:uncharacterized protein LOC116720768 n=1 Tax=Xiphophorus hellerii TaxID=8084 RepID=UPI0013B385B5|nr:uncharacterized protein LOC116720768 [Xiphophorus hellerii]